MDPDEAYKTKPLRKWLRSLPYIRALFQSRSEVTVRFTGRRFLSAPFPLKPYAGEHWEFAWLAVAAYVKTPAGQEEAQDRSSVGEQ